MSSITDKYWQPEQYVQGSYFQRQTSEAFRKCFTTVPSGKVLDIGCGDGEYSHFLASIFKNAKMLGIDSSPEMILHAKQHWIRENLCFEKHRIEDFDAPNGFDFVLSFWCLHWTEIDKSLDRIYTTLKPRGRLYAIFSSFSDNSILQAWKELVRQKRYQDPYRFTSPQSKYFFYKVINILNRLPFGQVKLKIETVSVQLPHINFFENLLLTMPFGKLLTPELIQELKEAFQIICERRYNGLLNYETRPIFLEAIK